MNPNPRYAGIDVGDSTHWVCVGENDNDIREFPAHTPGLRDLVDWLCQRGVTSVALEASGVYGLSVIPAQAGIQNRTFIDEECRKDHSNWDCSLRLVNPSTRSCL